MRVARKHGDFARKVIKTDAQHRKPAGGDRTFTEAGNGVVRRGIALQFKVGEPACQHEFRSRRPAILPQYGDLHRTVWRDANNAAVIQLDFSAAILPGCDLTPFEYGCVYQRWIGKNLISLRELNATFDKAQSGGARIWVCLLGKNCALRRRKKQCQSKDSGSC